MTTTPPITEAQFQQRVIDAAQRLGWWCHHTRAARTAKGWRTPLQGDPGFPDLVLARDGVVICAELKTDVGRLSRPQRGWLDALGDHGALWRPGDWDAVLAELRLCGREKIR